MTLRTWATPLTAGAFLIMAVTGGLMFFHLGSGLNKGLHEWAGWAMVAAVLAHTVLNWRSFRAYFRRPVAQAIGVTALAGLAFSFMPTGAEERPGSGIRAALGALGGARVETLAELAGEAPEAMLARLQAQGFEASPGATVRELTGGDRARQDALLSAAFAID